jgi:hypothetical protein
MKYQFLFYNHKREEYRVSKFMTPEDAKSFLRENRGFVLVDIRNRKMKQVF